MAPADPSRRPTSRGRSPGAGQSFASGARILSIGIASTGIFTFAYLATASHVLSRAAYSRISLCWAIMFVILSVIYRPIEQLLSRTIADRRARGLHAHSCGSRRRSSSASRSLFLVVALALRHQIQHGMFDGSASCTGSSSSACSPTPAATSRAAGWPATSGSPSTAALVFLESTSRFLFALAVAVGIGSGQGVVGLGMAVAPFASLSVMPFAFARVRRPLRAAPERGRGPGRRRRRRGSGPRPAGGGQRRPLAAPRRRLRRLGRRDHALRADADERRGADRRRQRRRRTSPAA